MDRTVLERLPDQGVLAITETVTLDLGDKHIYADATGGDIVITLPDVSAAIGSIITIFRTTAANKVEIIDAASESLDVTTLEGLDLDAQYDNIAIYSNGKKWMILCSDAAH